MTAECICVRASLRSPPMSSTEPWILTRFAPSAAMSGYKAQFCGAYLVNSDTFSFHGVVGSFSTFNNLTRTPSLHVPSSSTIKMAPISFVNGATGTNTLIGNLKLGYRIAKTRLSTKDRPAKSRKQRNALLLAIECAASVYGLKLTTARQLWYATQGGGYEIDAEDEVPSISESRTIAVAGLSEASKSVVNAETEPAEQDLKTTDVNDSFDQGRYELFDKDWIDNLDIPSQEEQEERFCRRDVLIDERKKEIEELKTTRPAWYLQELKLNLKYLEEREANRTAIYLPAWRERGCAPSRGSNDAYNGGAADGLWNGGGRTSVPDGLKKAAGRSGDERGDENRDDGSSSGRGGGGGDDGTGPASAIDEDGGMQDSFKLPSLGAYGDVEAVQKTIVQARTETLGKSHPETIASMAELADTLRFFGSNSEAEQVELDVVKARKAQTQTVPSVDAMLSRRNRLGWHRDNDDRDMEVLEIRNKLLGRTHPDTLMAAVKLGETWSYLGRHADAETLLRQYVQKDDSTPQSKDVEALMAMIKAQAYDENDRADLLHIEYKKLKLGREDLTCEKQDNPFGYRQTYNRSLEANEATVVVPWEGGYGPVETSAVLDVGQDMRRLADRWYKQGHHEKAQSMEIELLKLRLGTIDTRDPGRIEALEELADVCYKFGRYQQAESLKAEVVELKLEVFGRRHLETWRTMAELADHYYEQRRYGQAEQMERLLMVLKDDARDVERILAMHESAQKLFDRAIKGDTLPGEDVDSLVETANTMHLETLEEIKHRFGSFAAQRIAVVHDMKDLWFRYKQHEYDVDDTRQIIITGLIQQNAEEERRLILGLQKQGPEGIHASSVVAMSSLADIYMSRGWYGKAESLNLAVLELQERTLGVNHPVPIGTMQKIARNWKALGHWMEGQALQTHATSLQMEASSWDHV